MIEKFKSKVALNVKGKNINRFIKKLTARKINILSLKYIDKNEVKLIIYKEDLETVLKIKSIYEVYEEDVFGYLKIKRTFMINKHLIIFLLVGFSIFIFLTNVVFDIEVVHSNKEIRGLIKDELNERGIKKYTLKKSFKNLEKIKEDILNAYPDRLEWLEIEEVGTKYIVRAEEREIVTKKDNKVPRNLVAKKDAVIKKVTASSGVIVRNTDDYVKKGDVIVNGEVILQEEKTMGKVRALGKAYGEVWYVIKTEYPFAYYEEKETGKKKESYNIKFLNKDIELGFKKFKNKKVEEDVILSHPLLPIKLVHQKQKEVKVISDVLTFDEALVKAQEHSIKKMKKSLKKDEYIIRSKYLKSSMKENTVEVTMFFAIYEDITEYRDIDD
ncbi:MAG: sporulation protein YqfD [Bacilli bacterium]|nr:sporulation protein YqfD [Bacilli bacterium]